MKKSRLLALLLLSSMLVLPACGGGKSGGDEPQAIAVTLSQNEITLAVGDTVTLTATAEVENPEFEWASSRANVATVSEAGLVTAVAAGETKISATLKDNAASKAECVVTVVDSYIIQEDTDILIQTTFNDSYGAVFQDAALSLMKKEPKLHITYQKYSGDYTALKDDIINNVSTNTYPDIAVAYPDSVAEFLNANIQLKMDKYMNDSDFGWTAEEKADFFQAYLEEGQNYSISGTYSLPIAKSTEGMFYDAEKLIGLSLATIDPTINGGKALTEAYLNNLTWEELFGKLCPALMQYRQSLPEELRKSFLDDENSDWAIVTYDADANLFITLAEQYGYGYTSKDPVTGGGHLDFVNADMKGLMKTLNTAYLNHYFMTQGIHGTYTSDLFQAGQSLFCIGSTGGYTHQFNDKNAQEINVARIPQAAGKEAKLIQQGPSIAFLSHKVDNGSGKMVNDENRAIGSWLFYKELTSVSNCIKWATKTGYAPIRASVAESNQFLMYSNPDAWPVKTVDRLGAKNAGYQAEVAKYFFTSPVFKGSSYARTYCGALLTQCVGNKTAITDAELDQYFADAAEQIVLKMK